MIIYWNRQVASYVSDFVYVDMWSDSDGGSYYPNDENYGTSARPFQCHIALVRVASIASSHTELFCTFL